MLKLFLNLARRTNLRNQISRNVNIKNVHERYYLINTSKTLSVLPSLVSSTGATNPSNYYLTNVRQKSSKSDKKKQKKLDEEETDDDLEDDEELIGEVEKDAKIVTARLNSLRADLIIKAGLNMARNKVEDAFYNSKIRVNEKKIFKKAEQLKIGDEIDVIRGISNTNPNFLIVSRVIIVSAQSKGDNLNVTLKRFKSLLIENYSTDPWKPSSEVDR